MNYNVAIFSINAKILSTKNYKLKLLHAHRILHKVPKTDIHDQSVISKRLIEVGGLSEMRKMLTFYSL